VLETRQRAAAETAPRQVLTPEVRRALVQALEVRAREADATADLAKLPETALTPELRQTIAQMQETGRKLAKIDEQLKPPRLQLLRREPPEKERKPAVPILQIPTETPRPTPTFPKADTLKTPERILQYEVPTVSTSTTPSTADVPFPPTYTPVTVPKIGEVPTVDVPTVPTYETAPEPRPTPLPPGWWRLLPPSLFSADRAGEGAYRVQEGKRQILLLA
jgi:hypothetical protein